MTESTRMAIIALVNVDKEATEEERSRVVLALTGARPHGRTIRVREAAKILGVHRNTVSAWVKAGRLTAVKGCHGRVVGVTEESLATA